MWLLVQWWFLWKAHQSCVLESARTSVYWWVWTFLLKPGLPWMFWSLFEGAAVALQSKGGYIYWHTVNSLQFEQRELVVGWDSRVCCVWWKNISNHLSFTFRLSHTLSFMEEVLLGLRLEDELICCKFPQWIFIASTLLKIIWGYVKCLEKIHVFWQKLYFLPKERASKLI